MAPSDQNHDHEDPSDVPVLFGWNRSELLALALALGALVLWGLSIVVFGFAGLIVPGLILVLGAFVALIFISRG
jgi:fatty acid desaturase